METIKNITQPKSKPAKFKLKTIDIQAREWFDKINGNSYFSGVITLNYGQKDERTIKMPFQYGYGSQYEQEARNILTSEGLIDKGIYLYELRDKGVIIRQNIQRGCLKRDVVAFGF